MLNKLSKVETIISLSTALGGAAVVTYLISAVKEHFPVFSNMPWQGWALLFIFLALGLSVVISIIAYFASSAFREIRPLAAPANIGVKIVAFFPGHVDTTVESPLNRRETLLTLGVRAWTNTGTLYASGFKAVIVHGTTTYIGYYRISSIPVPDATGSLYYEHGSTLEDLMKLNGLTEKPIEGSITFVCDAPQDVFQNPLTKIRLFAYSTTGSVCEDEINIGSI